MPQLRIRNHPGPIISTALVISLMLGAALAQSGKGTTGAGRRTITLNVIAQAADGKQVLRDDFDLYDGGIPQEVDTFNKLDSGSQIVLMVDNSANLKADAGAVTKCALAVVNELFDDDEMMVVGYHETAEIIEDLTPDLAKLRTASSKFERKGFPNLFDALVAVADALAKSGRSQFAKQAVILISDGYDSESKTKFDEALRNLQNGNILLYVLQVPDRTRGALLRDKPKPPAALERLAAGTGGAIFPFEKAADSAKTIAEDLRSHWYRLTYNPAGINQINERRLLLMPRTETIQLRTKSSIPGRFN